MSDEIKAVEAQERAEQEPQRTPQEVAREQEDRLVQHALRMASGTLRLQQPIRARSTDIEELQYDMGRITGLEFVGAMDCDPGAYSSGRISAKQSLYLFALGVSKCMAGTLDARDVRERMGVQDAIKATQIASIFFNASNRAGDQRITTA